MALLQIMSYDSYPFYGEKNFITHPQNGLERHLSGLHRTYWEQSYYLLINDYNQSISLQSFTLNGEIRENYQFQLRLSNQFQAEDINQLQEVIDLIVSDCRIEIVHFHFQKPISLQMIPLFKRFEKIQLIQTMHDLSYACGGYYEDYSYVVPLKVEQGINQLNQIIFPDKSVEEIYRQQMQIGVPTKVIAHGVDMKKIPLSGKEQNEFKILFLGALGKEKGGDLAAEIINTELLNVSWHVLGRIESESLKSVETYYRYHGTYTSYDLAGKLAVIQPDLIIIPSQMIETFSYNLADSLAAGIPVLVPKKGAFLRIATDNVGWFVEGEQTATKYLETIKQIVNDENSYRQKKKAVETLRAKTVSEMNQEYEPFYMYAKMVANHIKPRLTAHTVIFEKKQYQQLVQTHQAFLQEKRNSEQHLENYGLLATEHNTMVEKYQSIFEKQQLLTENYQELLRHSDALAADNRQQQQEILQLEKLLSKRVVGKINRYLLQKDSISKK